MDSFGVYILSALSLVFVIEGLVYAIFPEAVRRMMQLALSLPLQNLRFLGLTMALAGFAALWVLSLF